MMTMPYIILAVSIFCLASEKWRWTAFCVAASCLFNVTAVNMWVIPAWYPGGDPTNMDIFFLAGLIDALTAYAIFKFGSGGRREQAGILSAFVLANVLLLFGNPLVYDSYAQLIFALNLAQIALFFGGVRDSLAVYKRFCRGLLGGAPAAVRIHRHNNHGGPK